MSPFAHDPVEEPHPERSGDDPEAPQADAAEQCRVEDGEDTHEKPTAAPQVEASEADFLEQQEEVPLDDEYDGEQ